MSDSLWPHGLWPTMLLCPWDFPGKSTGVRCHFLFQRIFLTQGSNLHLLHLISCIGRRVLYQRRRWHPTPVLLPGKSHGWRSLEGWVHGVAEGQTRLKRRSSSSSSSFLWTLILSPCKIDVFASGYILHLKINVIDMSVDHSLLYNW